MGVTVIKNQGNTHAAKVAIILLACCLILEVSSLAGLSTGVTSVLPQYLQIGSAVFVIGLLLFSIAAFLKKNQIASYSTIVASVTLIALGVLSLVTNFSTYNVGSAATVSSSLLIGIFLIMPVFKSDLQSKEKKPSVTEAEASEAASFAIQTVDATKTYVLPSNKVSAVKNLNLEVKKGAFVAIMGPSGSGKSTLLNLLGALDRPSSGQILIDGIDISNLNEDQLAKLRNEKIGFIFQAYNLIARSSVKRNLELPALVKGYSKEQREEKISNLLAAVQLSNKAFVKPKTLSGGEQQRIAICRALINDPEIILADEPTGNLDSKTGQGIMDTLRKLNSEKKTTIVVVTHDPEVAKRTDRIIYFRDGTILKEEITSAGMSS